jgi:hypothetical protein
MKKKKKKKGPPHRGWLAPLGPWGWFGHPQTGRSGGGRTTPMAPRAASHPLWGGSATSIFFFFFFIDLKGWLGHPHGLRGWPSHPFKSMKKKKKKKGPPHRGWLAPLGPWGWFGHPQTGRSGGGSAGLGVAEPPPWPKGWPATPMGVVRPPLFFFSFFIEFIGAFVFVFFFFC